MDLLLRLVPIPSRFNPLISSRFPKRNHRQTEAKGPVSACDRKPLGIGSHLRRQSAQGCQQDVPRPVWTNDTGTSSKQHLSH